VLPRGFLLGLFAVVPVLASVQETEGLRLARGKQMAVGQPMRTWSFASFPPPMQDWPTEVKGAFVELRCEDHQFSEAALILLRDDYRLRSYPAKLLSPADRALAEQLEVKRRTAQSPKLRTEYPLVMKAYTPETAAVDVSPHFAFYTGPDKEGSGKKAFGPGFLDQQKVWFEKVWTHLDMLGAPMPMDADPAPHKLNVYVTGTGLAKHKDGFAFGGADVIMHPNALGDGSSVVIHEFTHSVQYYSKGFRDSPYVGWFWECHANWSTHQFMPAYPPVLGHYAERAHYELNSSRHNYGSWPFLQVLAEDPRFGWSFPYEIWPACRRNDRDGALEDPLQTIMRLGVERKIWSDGVDGFGDTIGELAARMVGWDFQNQYYHLKDIRRLERDPTRISSLATVLEQAHDLRWHPLYSHAPKQYGVNHVWLEPTPGAKSCEVDFEGLADPAEHADWRVTLVAVDAKGVCRYSPTVRRGKVSIDVRPGEQFALAVAATPSIYTPQEFRPGFAVKRRYPYSIAVVGALPAAPSLRVAAPTVPGAPHANGGGFVAKSAKVAATAYVAKGAQVLDGAQVTERARICGQAIVRQSAKVGGDAVVSGLARVGERARVDGLAHVGGYAKLSGKATLTGRAQLLEYATLDGEGTVSGDVMIRGFGEVHLSPATEVTGTAMFAEDLEVHFSGCKTPSFDRGLFYGYLNADLLKKPKEVVDNRGLYAHWKFEPTHAPMVRDLVGDADGLLVDADARQIPENPATSRLKARDGTKVFARDGTRPFLLSTGSGCEVGGHVMSAVNLGFEAMVMLPPQMSERKGSLLSAKAPGVSLTFSVQGDDLWLQLNSTTGKSVTMLTKAGLPSGRWCRLGFAIKEGESAIFVDGRKVATEKVTLPLNFLFADTQAPNPASAPRVLIGSGFPGNIAEVKVTHTGELPGFDAIPLGAK